MMVMHVFNKIYTFILMLLLYSVSLQAQVSDADVKVAYVYQFCSHIDWAKNAPKGDFVIGIFADNKLMLKKFRYLAENRKIKNRKIRIVSIENILQLKKETLHILYVNCESNEKIADLFVLLKDKNTLFISNDCEEKEAIMINFIPSEKEGIVRFEINKKNTTDEGFIIHPDILLLGGTFLDVRKLFLEKEMELEQIKDGLEQIKKEVVLQEEQITEQNMVLVQKENIIADRNQKINQQGGILIEQQQQLGLLVNEIVVTKNIVNLNEEVLSEQKKQITKQQQSMVDTEESLAKQQTTLQEQAERIDKQKTVLTQRLDQIKMQRIFLVFALFIIALVLSLIYFVYKNYKIKKQANEELNVFTIEVLTQNEEITSQNEEILTQREKIEEAMEQLAVANEELAEHQAHLEQEVEIRTEQLLWAKEKAEESNRLKSEFLSNISHEIRTPMNAIVGFSSLLAEGEVENEKAEEYASIIQSNADSLSQLINGIVDLSKMKAGKLLIAKKDFDINSLVDELFLVFIDRIKKEKTELTLKLNKWQLDSFVVYSDQIRIKQVLINLLDNALKYTEKGNIEFGYALQENLRFFVSDTGIGIEEHKKKMVFERFVKIETNKDKLYRGTGLGLAICKGVVNDLDGEIGVNSVFGQGSEFFFIIPYQQNEE